MDFLSKIDIFVKNRTLTKIPSLVSHIFQLCVKSDVVADFQTEITTEMDICFDSRSMDVQPPSCNASEQLR